MSDRDFFTTGDGCRISYRFDGNAGKPVLVLSNSIATSLNMWDGQIDALARHFHVLRYDTRGHGASDAPAGAYSLDRLGRDVLELLDALEIARVHFCGLSLGGMIAQWLAVHAPERIDRLVLANTSAWLGPAEQWDELIRKADETQDMAAFVEMFIGNWFPKSLIENDKAKVEPFREMVKTTPPRGLAGCFAVVRDMDLRRTIALIPHPTLVIAGADDTVTLPAHSELIADTVPNARLLVLSAVHVSNVERQQDFLDAVHEFLLQRLG